jgi:hypothetical protein
MYRKGFILTSSAEAMELPRGDRVGERACSRHCHDDKHIGLAPSHLTRIMLLTSSVCTDCMFHSDAAATNKIALGLMQVARRTVTVTDFVKRPVLYPQFWSKQHSNITCSSLGLQILSIVRFLKNATPVSETGHVSALVLGGPLSWVPYKELVPLTH